MIRLGKHNPRVKALSRLARRRHREKEGKFVAEGPHLVAAALASAWPVEGVYFTPDFAAQKGEALALAQQRGVPLYELPTEVFSRVAATETPQGVLAVIGIPEVALEALLRPEPPLILVVDGLQDPGNLGTLIRTAQAAGATGALLLAGTVDLYSPKAVRATAGAVFHLPVVQDLPWAEALRFLQAAGLTLVVADPRGETPFYAADFTGPVALVIGSEGAGPRPEVVKSASRRVFIPMPGGTESLNAAVAGSLLLYEVVRQRQRF
ncbi:TrmH family RNA methyltransferase [Thermodesulfitimonas autotrophica]|uniref:TrmH family RNA methyltransferase n=1 Tax=Thermodesulfitimonas autotrophica TaxID=1894989 RepID=A0A3N5BLP7_9THEO|nr:RNA methyltransferase [Thermodesulfitimonas autotrophica]RPF46665.1 TrmH family RNA methyltransferase [Thermodesulfitimonas autotrophica]